MTVSESSLWGEKKPYKIRVCPFTKSSNLIYNLLDKYKCGGWSFFLTELNISILG